MAETVICGRDGSVTLPSGHAAKLNAWSASFPVVLSNITNYSSGGYRELCAGIVSGSGSASGVMSHDAASTSPGFFASRTTAGTLRLTAAANSYIEGSAFISNISVQSDLNSNEATITFDFEFTGNISTSSAWDETA